MTFESLKYCLNILFIYCSRYVGWAWAGWVNGHDSTWFQESLLPRKRVQLRTFFLLWQVKHPFSAFFTTAVISLWYLISSEISSHAVFTLAEKKTRYPIKLDPVFGQEGPHCVVLILSIVFYHRRNFPDIQHVPVIFLKVGGWLNPCCPPAPEKGRDTILSWACNRITQSL